MLFYRSLLSIKVLIFRLQITLHRSSQMALNLSNNCSLCLTATRLRTLKLRYLLKCYDCWYGKHLCYVASLANTKTPTEQMIVPLADINMDLHICSFS